MAEPAPTDSPAIKTAPISVEAPVTVRDLSTKLGVKVTDLIGELIKLGVMASINDRLDFDNAQAAAAKFDKTLVSAADDAAGQPQTKTTRQGATRPPVVAVMGHVDHGKTSLLDKIRQTGVAEGEAGGITQHVRAHQVKYKNKSITFLDTPGHEAFSLLREHGAHLTDIALIVVAADDGLKPQTIEAINFAKKAGVKIIVAITKSDKPNTDLARIKKQLADTGLQSEEWGGDTIIIETSAKTGAGLDKLLEMILLVAEVEELGAPQTGLAEGTIIETHIARGKGTLATLLVEAGELKSGDYIVAGQVYGKIRSLEDTDGKTIKTAGPSTPVVAAGWKDLPALGQRFKVVKTEAAAKKLAQGPKTVGTVVTKSTPASSAAGGQAMKTAGSKQLAIVIKADVHGSLEALLKALEQIGNEETQVKVVAQSLGDINESDVSLAESTSAQVIGFNVAVPVKIKQLAQTRGVELKIYHVIYELLDELKARLEAMVEPKFVTTKVGELEIKGIFKVTKNNLICGGQVLTGKLSRELLVKIGEGEDQKEIGKVVNVQREQQDAKEVLEGQMCGLNISTPKKTLLKEGDKIGFYSVDQV